MASGSADGGGLTGIGIGSVTATFRSFASGGSGALRAPDSVAGSAGGFAGNSSGRERLAIRTFLRTEPKRPLLSPDVRPRRDVRAQKKDSRGVVRLGQESLRGSAASHTGAGFTTRAGLAQLGRRFAPASEVGRSVPRGRPVPHGPDRRRFPNRGWTVRARSGCAGCRP